MSTVIYTLFIAFGSYIIWWQVKYSRNLKPIRYADHYNSVDLLDATEAPPLSFEEAEAFTLLSQTRSKSVLAEVIHRALQSNDINQFRQLICDLKAQGEVCPNELTVTIGAEALNKIMSL